MGENRKLGRPHLPATAEQRRSFPSWLREPGSRINPPMRPFGIVVMALVANSACGRSPMVGTADARYPADSGVVPASDLRDARIAGEAAGVGDDGAAAEGGVVRTGSLNSRQ